MTDKADLAKLLLKHGYTGIRKIGEGSFGVAVLVQDGDGAQSVCKSVKVNACAMEDLLTAKKEARLLSHLQHPNIVRYRTSFLDWGWFCIVMDYCDGGSVSEQIEKLAKKSSPMQEEQIACYVAQMAMALDYLHEKGILHRDLKPSNLFLRRRGDLVVGDFGLSKVLDCTVACAKTLVGTPYYLSPEVIQDKPYFWPSDIWSVGCIVFELSALKVPFDGANLSSLAQKICFGPLPEIPSRYSVALRELCYDLMSREPEERPSAKLILERSYVQEKAAKVLTKSKTSLADENPKAKNVVLDQFHRLDLNGDGVLDRAELAKMLKHLDSGVWSEKLIDELLHSVDVNDKGFIDLDEFVHWVFGGQDTAGLVERCQQHMEACMTHVGDLVALKGDLLLWRQSIDIGCLSILPPSTCVETCDTLAALANELNTFAEGIEKDEEKAAEVEKCCGLLDQMNAILYGVEQLLIDYGRHHVRRTLIAESKNPPAVLGWCCELEDGTRLGQCPDGLGDASLKSLGGHWEVLHPGEQILEVKGFAFSKAAALASAKAAAAAKVEAAPKARSKFSLAKAAGGKPPSKSTTTPARNNIEFDAASQKKNQSSPARNPADGTPARADGSPHGRASSPPRPADAAAAAETAASASAQGPEPLAASVTLCTSRGRELTFGAGKSTGSLGTPFSFKAPEGEEIEDIIFLGGTCTGVRAAPTAPVLAAWDFWDRRKMEKVQNAFRKAAGAIFSSLVPWSWQKSERQGKHALLQARRLGLPDVGLPDEVKERQHSYSMSMTPPSYWDLGGMKLEHGNTVGTVSIRSSEHKALQELLQATCCRKSARSLERSMVPSQLELVHGVRIQNWQTWAEFQAQQEVIAGELKTMKSNGKKVSTDVSGLKTAGFLEELRAPLEEEANTVWLFHGLSDEAIDLIGDSGFDIDRAGVQAGTMYGRGVYLAECCSRADEVLSTLGQDGLHAMLVCRVTLGNVHVDCSTLPDMAQIVRSCVEGKYHSVLSDSKGSTPRANMDTSASREFIVYNKDQVYPEFMLVYRRVYD